MKKIWQLLMLLLIPVATLALQACGPSHKAQEDCGFVQNVYGERISWKGNVPITLNIHHSVPESYIPAIESAMRVWERTLGRPLFILGSRRVTTNNDPRQDGINLIYLRNTWEEDKKSEQARSSVYWVNNEIREADIKLNGTFNFYIDLPPGGTRDVHLESLMIHELGHVLGMKHKDNGGSVMATYLASNVKRTNIATGDYQNAMCEY